MGKSLFFITTPIYYINATPHVGHAYTQIAADARARFERARGREVYFLTGTDENALKVARAAQAQNRDPQEFADELAEQFKAVWAALNISHDDFVRTTEPRHRDVVQEVVERLWEGGHLRLGAYEGWYSVPDETFFRGDEVEERGGSTFIASPGEDQSREPLEWVSEAAHFFRLPEFAGALLRRYAEEPSLLQPESRRNETLRFIERGLQETSISRRQEWGIPLPAALPDSEGRVVYVWFPDALLNYASAPGYLSPDPERQAFFERCWPPDVQLMSKDIFTRFHTTLWPALLSALGLEMPRLFFAHGFWTVSGRKIAKRDPSTVVDPVGFARFIAEQSGAEQGVAVDALRYYCLREVSFGSDGDFSRAGCLARYNSDLANGLGNLTSRALSMMHQYFGGRVPPGDGDLGLRVLAERLHPEVEAAYEALDFQGALEAVWQVVGAANRLIEERKPWASAKEGRLSEIEPLLRELLGALQWCAHALHPVMPTAAARLLGTLRLSGEPSWERATQWSALAPGHEFDLPAPIFPRIPAATIQALARDEEARRTQALEDAAAATAANAASKSNGSKHIMETAPQNTTHSAGQPEPTPSGISSSPLPGDSGALESQQEVGSTTIAYEDFAKVDLRVGRVLSADAVPKADKLLRLTVDLGTEQRQILAGLAQHFAPESLIGQSVLVVANLAPRKMRGLESQGMILAASTPDGPPLALATVSQDVPPGSIVK
jgi:methionyl-tRNA synthetase